MRGNCMTGRRRCVHEIHPVMKFLSPFSLCLSMIRENWFCDPEHSDCCLERIGDISTWIRVRFSRSTDPDMVWNPFHCLALIFCVTRMNWYHYLRRNAIFCNILFLYFWLETQQREKKTEFKNRKGCQKFAKFRKKRRKKSKWMAGKAVRLHVWE